MASKWTADSMPSSRLIILFVAIALVGIIARFVDLSNAFHFSQSLAGLQEAVARHGAIHVKIWIISLIVSGIVAIWALLILGSVLAYSRIRRGAASVFISYHHSRIAIVARIVRVFKKTGIE